MTTAPRRATSEQKQYGNDLAAVLRRIAAAEAAMQASGTFEVAMTPRPGEPAWLARMAMTKTYAGALVGTAAGEFLSAGDPASGAAGYVAAERIEGTLDGRAGSFVVFHHGVMDRGTRDMRVSVAPGSGTGALAGISGTLAIRIDGGQHLYTLDYDLPD